MAQGQIDKSEALGKWIQAVNSLSGLAKVLGVERKARSMPWLALPAGLDGSGDERRASPYPARETGARRSDDRQRRRRRRSGGQVAMISQKTFAKYAADPAAFRADLLVDVDGTARCSATAM